MDIRKYWQAKPSQQNQVKSEVLDTRPYYTWRVTGRINIQFTDGAGRVAVGGPVTDEVEAATEEMAKTIVALRQAKVYQHVDDVDWLDVTAVIVALA